MNDRVHLRRLESIRVSHPVYFITSCAADRHPLLASPRATEILRNEGERARDHHGWLIGRYVVMPDHVHFFCAEVEGGGSAFPVAVCRRLEGMDGKGAGSEPGHIRAGMADKIFRPFVEVG